MSKIKLFLVVIMIAYLISGCFFYFSKKEAYKRIEVNVMINITVEEFLLSNGRFPQNNDELFVYFEKLFEKKYIKRVLKPIKPNVLSDSSSNSFYIYDRIFGLFEPKYIRFIDKGEFNLLSVLLLKDNVLLFSDSLNSKLYKNFNKVLLFKDNKSIDVDDQDSIKFAISSIVKEYYRNNKRTVHELLLNFEPYEPIIKNKVVFKIKGGNYNIIYSELRTDIEEYKSIFDIIINYLNDNYNYDEAIVPFVLPQIDEAESALHPKIRGL